MSHQKNIAEFILKLTTIMEKYPEIVSWNHDGTQLVIFDSTQFISVVQPEFFKHDRFQSFIRQLNMYGFHKICRNKLQINFKNDLFRKDNQANFNLIKRKKRQAAELRAQLLERQSQIREIISTRYSFSHPSLSLLINELLNYKARSLVDMEDLRRLLDDLSRELNQRKSKKVKPLISNIKELFSYTIDSANKVDFNIDQSEPSSQKEDYKVYNQLPILPVLVVPHEPTSTQYNPAPLANPGLGITNYCSFNSVTNFMV